MINDRRRHLSCVHYSACFWRVQNDCVGVSFWFQRTRKTHLTRSHVLFIVSHAPDMLHSFAFSFLNNNNQKYKFHCQIFQRASSKTFKSLWIQTFTTQIHFFYHHLLIIIYSTKSISKSLVALK